MAGSYKIDYEERLKADNIDDNTIDFEMSNWKNHQSKRYYMENSYDFKSSFAFFIEDFPTSWALFAFGLFN